MPPPPSASKPERLVEFSRKHRTGLVALVFTDLVDSTALFRDLGDQAATSINQRRRQLIRESRAEFPESEEIETAGDSFLLVFSRASEAVRFALVVQARLRELTAAAGRPVRERIGIHLGEVVIAEFETSSKPKDLYGIQLTACARVMSLAQGGQILLTRAVFDSARAALKGEGIPGVGPLSWVSHGFYQLKGLEEPLEVCEVGDQPPAPPTTSPTAQRFHAEGEEPVLGWRPGLGQEVPNTAWILEEKLGEGGFGEVWKARHPRLKEYRVFKFCFRAERARALKREVTLLGLVKERIGEHPHIVRLHDVFLEAPPYYLEMDYVPGKDIRTWCEAQGGIENVPLATRIEIVAQAAEALQAAHDAGVIHRDVKPSNILVATSTSGGPAVLAKLTDFGIGQVVSGEVLAGMTRAGFTQTLLTDAASSRSGTQLYMAPELFAGQPASTRSDIYSLGTVLYQLIAGDFTAPVTTDWADRISDPLLRDDLQPCFAGDPQKRYAGVAQLANRLRRLPERRQERVREQERLAARERAAYRRGILRTAAFALVLVTAFAGLAFFALDKARQEAHQRQRVETQELRLREGLYAADIRLAQQALAADDFSRAVTLLDGHQPAAGQTDIRGWEWHYLRQQCRSDSTAALPGREFDSALALSADQRLLVAIHGTAGARVCDLTQPERPWRDLPVHSLPCNAAFSPTDPWLALASPVHLEIRKTNNWETLGLWFSSSEGATQAIHEHPNLRNQIHVWPGVRNPIQFHPDGKSLVSDAAEGICFWSTAEWRPTVVLPNVHLIRAFEAWGDSIRFSQNGARIALATEGPDGSHISVWQTADLQRLGGQAKPLLRHPVSAARSLMGIALSPDGRFVAGGYFYGSLALWDITTGSGSAALTNIETSVMTLQWLSDSRTLVGGSRDRNVHLWRVEPGALVRPLRRLWGHTNEIWSMAMSQDGSWMATGGKDGQIHLWEPSRAALEERPHLTKPFPVPGVNPQGTLFTPDSSQLITWHQDGAVYTHTLPGFTNAARFQFGTRLGSAETTAWFPEHNLLVEAASPDGRLQLLQGTNRRPVATLSGHPRPPESIRIDPAGTTLVSACCLRFRLDGTTLLGHPDVYVWNLPDGSLRHKITLKAQPNCVTLSPDAKTLAAGFESEIQLWSLVSEQKIANWPAHKVGVVTLGFSCDGSLLASGGYDNLAKLWDTQTTRLLASLEGHTGGPAAVAFTPDQKNLVTAGIDLSLRFWNIPTGRELLSLPLDNLTIRIGFSPDGRYLAATDPARQLVQVYDSHATLAP